MDFPVELKFAAISATSKLTMSDANGRLVYMVKKKPFAWKEKVTVFADDYGQQPAFTIMAERAINSSGMFSCCDMSGRQVCAVRNPVFSIWRARCEILEGETASVVIRESNPWTKVFDRFLSEIPFVGLATPYLLHPVYDVADPEGNVLMRLTKRPAFMQGKFSITKHADVEPDQEAKILLALLLFAMKVHWRG